MLSCVILYFQKWVDGDWTKVKLYKDQWLSGLDGLTQHPITPEAIHIAEKWVWVADTIKRKEDGLEWNIDITLNIPLGGIDIRCWDNEPAGTCSIKAIYKKLVHRVIVPQTPLEDGLDAPTSS